MKRTRTRKTEIENVVLYARVSTVEQAERDLSLPAQLDALRAYCRQRNYTVVHEYVEPGASARDDDRRPVFRQMIVDATSETSATDAILVLYTSRFYRNATRARALKEVLRRKGVRVVAINQETADDPMGSLVEGVFELIDEYESLVNGMRTSEAMRKNAELGYFNGSAAPFGFMAEKIEVRPGQYKRKIAPCADEVPTHNEVFRLYVAGRGAKGVARELNQRGLRYRKGKLWSKDLVLKVIDEAAAAGTYYWGRRDSKTKEPRPREDWIALKCEPIMDAELFEMAQVVRRKRDPERNPGRTGSSPMLLAGLIECGMCGASYQLETSGKTAATGVYNYSYYNCRSHLRVGKEQCEGFRVRDSVLEDAVLEHMAAKIFTFERCRQMVNQTLEETGMIRQKTAAQRKQLENELAEVERRLERWHEGYESGDMPKDIGLDRVRALDTKRQELKEALAKVVPLRSPPPHLYTEQTISRFQESVRSVFLSRDSSMTKNYLKFLVEKIVVNGPEVTLHARSDAAVRMMAAPKTGGAEAALTDPTNSPTFVVDWLQREDSNLGPSG